MEATSHAHPLFSIATVSLGSLTHHTLPDKLRKAAELGYDGVEIFIPDFEDFVEQVRNRHMHQDVVRPYLKLNRLGGLQRKDKHLTLLNETEKTQRREDEDEDDEEEEEEVEEDDVNAWTDVCARAIGGFCQELGLTIVCLQPLRDFENFHIVTSNCPASAKLAPTPSSSKPLSVPATPLTQTLSSPAITSLASTSLPSSYTSTSSSSSSPRSSVSSSSTHPSSTTSIPELALAEPSICACLDKALERAEHYVRLMPLFRTNLLLVCSNYLSEDPRPSPTWSWTDTVLARTPPETTNTAIADMSFWENYRDNQIVAFKRLGAVAQHYGVKVGYESLAWGTVVNRWEQIWEVVKSVNMDSVGIILDSFNCLGQQWADPSEPNGRRPLSDSVLTSNLSLLQSTIPGDKILLYQIADAARPNSPIFDAPSAPARMTWSRATRLYPCETERGAFMPVAEFTQAVMATGYRGAWSLEVFNKSLADSSPSTVEQHARRGIVGLRKLWQQRERSGEGAGALVPLSPNEATSKSTLGLERSSSASKSNLIRSTLHAESTRSTYTPPTPAYSSVLYSDESSMSRTSSTGSRTRAPKTTCRNPLGDETLQVVAV